jgi:tRNA (adenine37-N6)-methyltransferase
MEDLKQFSHVWLLFLFHENREKPFNENTMKMKIRPPRLGGDKVSIFATSKFINLFYMKKGTPHRPNPIGLSKAKIEKIEGATIYLSGIDLIDGTPIVDISLFFSHFKLQKEPYIPLYDSIQKNEESKIAEWIESPSLLTKVEFKEEAVQVLKESAKSLEYFSSAEEMMEAITQGLSFFFF